MKKYVFLILMFFFSSASAFQVHTKILGVMQTGDGEEGITADLYVTVVNGTGKVFISTIPLTKIDTQASARLAKEVACETLNMECSNYDFYYEIYSESPIVGGPSAGGAMTVATMAALKNLTLYENVFMTGTVNPDGSIGPVGGILPKAEAGYKAGADYILIPKGQSLTYIEETRTTTIGIITQTETIVKPVNVSFYALSNWGLKVVEVPDVETAFEKMTGYEITRKTKPKNLVTADYLTITKEMSTDLLKYTRELLDNATDYLNSKSLSYSYTQEIENLLKQSRTYLEQAEQLGSLYQHYSAASYCVQSSILSNYAKKLISYYSGEYQTKEDIKSEIDNTKLYIDNFENSTISYQKIDHIYDIELLIVSIDRLREAENLIDESYKSYYSKKYEDALYYDAFAEIRLLTAEKWRDMTLEFEGELNLTFDVNLLVDLARDRLESAKVYHTYASTVSTSSLLQSAQNKLDSATEAYNNKKYIFSIFESLKSMAESNLAMEVRGLSESDLPSKINTKMHDAEEAIDNAKSEGLLPILAISYYEYSKSYDDPYQQLVFLSYSKEFAKITNDLVRAISRESGKNFESRQVYIRKKAEESTTDVTAYMFILAGFLAGITISLYNIEKLSKRK